METNDYPLTGTRWQVIWLGDGSRAVLNTQTHEYVYQGSREACWKKALKLAKEDAKQDALRKASERRKLVRNAVKWWRQNHPGMKVKPINHGFFGWVLWTTNEEARAVAKMEDVITQYEQQRERGETSDG